MFHSSGTAIGNVEAMKRVEAHHQRRGDKGDRGVGREQQDQGGDDLDAGAADVGEQRGAVRGPQVVREVLVVRSLERLARDPGRVAHHRWDHHREVLAELGEAGADPHDNDQDLEGDDHVRGGEGGEEDDGG